MWAAHAAGSPGWLRDRGFKSESRTGREGVKLLQKPPPRLSPRAAEDGRPFRETVSWCGGPKGEAGGAFRSPRDLRGTLSVL